MKIVKKEIDMLCWFDSEGKPHPIRFRALEEDGSECIVPIDKIIFSEKEKLGGIKMYVYHCQVVLQKMERIVVIKYSIDDCKWILFKM